MNNRLSYCGLVDAKLRASDKDLNCNSTTLKKIREMSVVICTRDLTKVLKASLYLPNTLVKINSGNFKPRNGRGPRNRIPNVNCKMVTFDFDDFVM